MNIVFVESLGMCECTINKSLATLKNQGHTVTFYHDRNENEEVLIERAQNAEVVVVSNIPLRKHFFENCPKLRMLSVALPEWTISIWKNVKNGVSRFVMPPVTLQKQ